MATKDPKVGLAIVGEWCVDHTSLTKFKKFVKKASLVVLTSSFGDVVD